MQTSYPGALSFLADFERELRARAAFKRYFTRREHARVVETGPYWSMFDVGEYTLAPFKVVWKDQASEFAAAVMPPGSPLPLPNHKVILVACEGEDEAHYLCGALNSLPVRLFVASYVIETQISTHTVKNVHIPRFDTGKRAHAELVRASRAAHLAVAAAKPPDEAAVDMAAAKLWGITRAELKAMWTFLDTLRKRDLATA